MTAPAEGAAPSFESCAPPEGFSRRSRFPVALYAATTFLSAFLLFEVQPLIAKYILPWFGGGSTVWTTTMLFFQVTLIGGYAYAHFVSDRLAPRKQGALHLALLVLAIAALPIIPRASLRGDGTGDPTWRILLVLTVAVGAPYLLLSSTAPLIQRWFAHDHPGASPYRLYALSNAGSLLALLTYPVVFERLLGLHAQAWLWSGGYVAFVALCGLLATGFFRGSSGHAASFEQPIATADAEGTRVTVAGVAFWLLLPACASALLIATTNQLTQDVAAIPLLWVVPLSLYLLTFILCFGDERTYRPSRDLFVLALALAAGVYVMNKVGFEVLWQVLLYSFALFMCCFALHGELVRLRPAARHLTAFYLAVSVGGALGGVFVALVAPVIFRGYWEYHLTLALTPVLVIAARGLDLLGRRASAPNGPRAPRRGLVLLAGGAAVAGTAALGAFLVRDIHDANKDLVERDRNFYGSVRVFEFNREFPESAMVVMEHGRILHGFQFTAPEKRGLGAAYYGPNSGVGVALRDYPKPESELSVGVIGLGAGMLAAYAKPDDDWRFYEINPMVTRLAEEHFTYLADARDRGAHLHVLHGDGRTVLEQQLDHGGELAFDVLVLDAFSSDAIPVHLLTKEAFDLYWRVLKPDGVLAINISNRHVDLSPVVRAAAEHNGKEAHWVSGQAGDGEGVLASVWVLVTSNRAFLDTADVAAHLEEWPENARAPRLWTDDFSNVLSLMRLY
ncbi:MAG: fused MFS/spermidine synthase [Dehalococcoidia bacterium]|nr:fused MFS/spermidine synthase [Dehalococcoidia bacterium]